MQMLKMFFVDFKSSTKSMQCENLLTFIPSPDLPTLAPTLQCGEKSSSALSTKETITENEDYSFSSEDEIGQNETELLAQFSPVNNQTLLFAEQQKSIVDAHNNTYDLTCDHSIVRNPMPSSEPDDSMVADRLVAELNEAHFTEDDWVWGMRRCVAENPAGFSYLKCLEADDQETFIRTFFKLLIQKHGGNVGVAILEGISGDISLEDWKGVIAQCFLKHKYYVYRWAYWGENSGRMIFNARRSPYHALIRVYGQGKVKNLLISNNRIQSLKVPNRSNWTNMEIGLNAEFLMG